MLKMFVSPKDIGLDVECPDRGNVAIWNIVEHVSDDVSFTYYVCTNCGRNKCLEPSTYCPACGSLMYNVKDAVEHYSEKLKKYMVEQDKEKKGEG